MKPLDSDDQIDENEFVSDEEPAVDKKSDETESAEDGELPRHLPWAEKLGSEKAVSDEEEDGEFENDENHVSDDGADEEIESE